MITSGFFDSIKGDRKYNARQFTSLFDGIIRDGIFMSIGDCLRITATDPTSMKVIIGTGRAWFNHTWILNDAPEPIDIPQSELLLDRIDAVVIEVDESLEVRNAVVKVVKGVPTGDPDELEKPVLTNDEFIHQYPLAWIKVSRDCTYIRQADIENGVGSEPCPFVTGILDTVDTTILVAQWKDEWERIKETYDSEWTEWSGAKLEVINNWFQFVKDTLGEDAAVGLANGLWDLKQELSETVVNVNKTLEDTKNEIYEKVEADLSQLVPITQAQYNAMGAGRPKRLYFIVG